MPEDTSFIHFNGVIHNCVDFKSLHPVRFKFASTDLIVALRDLCQEELKNKDAKDKLESLTEKEG